MDTQRRNYYAFLWHALWLAFTMALADHNTVLPGLILKTGGSEIHIGILTSIVLALPMLAQLIFAGYLSSRKMKKPFLLLGINMRVVALGGVAWTLSGFESLSSFWIIFIVYGWMILFSVSGAFAGVSYNDILGKSITGDTRKKFIVLKQAVSSAGIMISAIMARFLMSFREYPDNYFLLFTLASIFLLIASFGFWMIKEKPTENPMPRRSFLEIIKIIPSTLKADANIRHFIKSSNLIGASISLIPFYIVFASQNIDLSDRLLGSFIFYHFGGMVVSNLLWSKLVGKHHFKGILYSAAVISAILPILMILYVYIVPADYIAYIFILSGAAFSAYRISAEGVLLEISNETNRSLYSGIFGAFNIVIAIFPLIAGVAIEFFGYHSLFIAASLLAFSALFIIPRLNCQS